MHAPPCEQNLIMGTKAYPWKSGIQCAVARMTLQDARASCNHASDSGVAIFEMEKETLRAANANWSASTPAKAFEKAAGYSLRTAVLNSPVTSSRPMATFCGFSALGSCLLCMEERNDGQLIANIPVGFDAEAPHLHWHTRCSFTWGSCNSNLTHGEVQILTFCSSSGIHGCSLKYKLPKRNDHAAAKIPWKKNSEPWATWRSSRNVRPGSPRNLSVLRSGRGHFWASASEIPSGLWCLAAENVSQGAPQIVAETRPDL